MQLIDDRVGQRRSRRHIFAPVKGTAKEEATAHRAVADGLLGLAPNATARKGRGGRVEEDNRRIESVASTLGAIDAPVVAERRRQTRNLDVPVIAGAVFPR